MKDTNLTVSNSSRLFKKTTHHWSQLQACLPTALSRRCLHCGLPACQPQCHAEGPVSLPAFRTEAGLGVSLACVDRASPRGVTGLGTQPGRSACRESLGPTCCVLPPPCGRHHGALSRLGMGGGVGRLL